MIATEQMKCCICKIEIDNGMDYHYHNPTPLGKNDSDVCCTYCNITKVIPARIAQNKEEHPAMKSKKVKEETLESQKQELEDSMIASDYGTMICREMDKIREEWKPWVEKEVTDTHKVIYEAEKRVKKMGTKDIYKYDKVAVVAKDNAVGERIKAENLSEPIKDLLKVK